MANSPVFVDTVFVIALVNRRDRYHAQASELASRFDTQPLMTTDAVLLEIGNALARSFKAEAIAIIERFLASADVHLVRQTPVLFDRAFALYQSRPDKAWGLVDCLSFIAMQDAGAGDALTFDQHFVQAGYRALMREQPSP